MRRGSARIALALCLLPLALPAHAQVADYVCKAPGAHYDQKLQPLPGPDYRVSGTLRATRFEPGNPYFPVAGVRFQVVGARTALQLRFEGNLNPGSRKLALSAFALVNGKQKTMTLGYAQIDEDIRFELLLTRDGKAWAQIGPRRTAFKFAAKGPVSLGLSCSSGDFLFSELKAGN